MAKWEYMSIVGTVSGASWTWTGKYTSEVEALKYWGKYGWELVTTETHMQAGTTSRVVHVMRKPLA